MEKKDKNNNISTNPEDSSKKEKKKKTGKVKNYKESFTSWLKFLISEQHLTEITYGRLNKIALKVINAVRVFIASGKKFIIDDCFIKSSSLGYTVLISLIPTLTVTLTIVSVFSGVGDKKSEMFREFKKFLSEHNLERLNFSPVLDAISRLIDNAASIGVVGAVIVIFSATAVLRTLEQSLNNIWKVKRQRTFFMKIIYYWAALTLGPIMIISGNTIANKFSNIFLEPNHNKIVQHDDKIWLVGNRGDIRYKELRNKSTYILDKHNIDWENQQIFKYNGSQNNFKKEELHYEESDFSSFTFKDIQFINDRGWIIGNTGILLRTSNSGKKWFINRIGTFNFNDIHMLDSDNGFAIADNGYLLKTTNGGKAWSVITWDGVTQHFNGIKFYKNRGFIVGQDGLMLTSNDSGESWKIIRIPEAKPGKTYTSLNDIFILDDNNFWIAGDNGIILKSSNGGKNWKMIKFKRYNYTSAYFLNRKLGFIIGEKGTILGTRDSGDHWERIKLPSKKITSILRHKNVLWVAGFAGMVMNSENRGITWQGKKGTNFFVYLINFLAPFVFIWLLFLLIYMALPNIKIPLKPAAIGAAFTGALWVLFSMLFQIYIKAFANSTFAIYGALAAIPIFLILIYGSSLIIFFGAEVSYTIMHPETYLKVGRKKKLDDNYLIFNGINLLYNIYKKFELNRGESRYKDLLKLCLYRYDEVDYLIDTFKKENLIFEKFGGGFLPSTSAKNIKLEKVLSIIHDFHFEIPPYRGNDSFKRKLNDIFSNLNNSQNDILSDLTLDKLL